MPSEHFRNREVAIIAPSLPIKSKRELKKAELEAATRGITTVRGRNIFKSDLDFTAGTFEERRDDLLWSLAYPYIWLAYGGYAADQLVDVFRSCVGMIAENQNRIIGYSDGDLWSNILFAHGIKSVWGPHFAAYHTWIEDTRVQIADYIHGSKIEGLPESAAWIKSDFAVEGTCQGRLLASGLTTLLESSNKRDSPLKLGTDPIILLLDLNETPTMDLRRFAMGLADADGYERVVGVIFARTPGVMEHAYSKWVKKNPKQKIITQALGKNGRIPVAFVGDTGHVSDHDRRTNLYFRLLERSSVHQFSCKQKGENCSLINLET